jgi:RNA recognition motif-containing protein
VGGLPQGVTTDDLKDYFSRYGPITDAVVMLDRRTNRSRGFGFIRFGAGPAGTAAAEDALTDFYGHYIDGKWIEVKRATPQELTPMESRAAAMSGDSMSEMFMDGTMSDYQSGDSPASNTAMPMQEVQPLPRDQLMPRGPQSRRKRSGATRSSRDSRKGLAQEAQGDGMGWEHHFEDHENHGYFPAMDSQGMSENDQNRANIEFLLRATPVKAQPQVSSYCRQQDESEFTRDDFLSLEVGPWRSPLGIASC